MAILDGFKQQEPKKPGKQKAKEVLTGEIIEGEIFIDEHTGDTGPLTPQLVEVQEMRDGLQEDRGREIIVRQPQVPISAAETKAVNTDLLDIPKVCDQCYLMDKCAHFKPKHTCYYRNEVSINGPQDLMELVKMVLEMQSQRVLFGRVIEQSEGGYIDKNLSDEMKRLLEYMKMFKDLSAPHESGDGIEIKVKGKAAQEVAKQGGGGILSQIFGGGTSQ